MILAYSNIKNYPDMAPGKVQADAIKIAGYRPGIWCGQEIDFEDGDTRIFEEAFGADYTWRQQHYEIPIALKKPKFAVHRAGIIQTHAGWSHENKPVSPARYISWVVVSKKDRPRLQPFVVMNEHRISRQSDTNRVVRDRARHDWETHHARWVEMVNTLHRNGLSVLSVGDLNRHHVDLPHRDARWLINDGIDKAMYLPSERGTKVDLITAESVRLNSDHDLKLLHLHLYKGKG